MPLRRLTLLLRSIALKSRRSEVVSRALPQCMTEWCCARVQSQDMEEWLREGGVPQDTQYYNPGQYYSQEYDHYQDRAWSGNSPVHMPPHHTPLPQPPRQPYPGAIPPTCPACSQSPVPCFHRQAVIACAVLVTCNYWRISAVNVKCRRPTPPIQRLFTPLWSCVLRRARCCCRRPSPDHLPPAAHAGRHGCGLPCDAPWRPLHPGAWPGCLQGPHMLSHA